MAVLVLACVLFVCVLLVLAVSNIGQTPLEWKRAGDEALKAKDLSKARNVRLSAFSPYIFS
jgi:hypothetical protein